MSRGPDAGTRLERALVRAALAAGVDARIVAADWTRWASATFSGAHHSMTLEAIDSAALEAWLAGLPEFEFQLHDHLVADLSVASVRCADDRATIEIEALTVELR